MFGPVLRCSGRDPQREAGRFLFLIRAGRKSFFFDAVVLAVPPEAAVALLHEVPSITRKLARLRSVPAWSLLLTFRRPLRVPFEIAVAKQNKVLTGFIRQNTKPQRNNQDETWWLQTKPEWAALQKSDSKVESAMLQALQEEVWPLDKFEKRDIVASHLHHWQAAWVPQDFAFSAVADLARDGAIIDLPLRLALCGDWVHTASGNGGSIQGAFLSGGIAARKVLAASA